MTRTKLLLLLVVLVLVLLLLLPPAYRHTADGNITPWQCGGLTVAGPHAGTDPPGGEQQVAC